MPDIRTLKIQRLVVLVAAAVSTGLWQSKPCLADAMERMNLSSLEATHNAVAQCRLDRTPVTLTSRYDDVRALLHVHSLLSHDSNGTPE